MERSAQAESDRLSYSLSAWDYCIHSISESSLAPVFSIVILITTFCDKQQKLWIKYVKRYYSLDTFQNRGILLECLKKKKKKIRQMTGVFCLRDRRITTNLYNCRGTEIKEIDTLINDTQNGSSYPLVKMPALFSHQSWWYLHRNWSALLIESPRRGRENMEEKRKTEVKVRRIKG